MRKNLVLSLSFGIFMGLVFPLFSFLFVDFKSRLHLVIFICGCVAAGFIVGFSAYALNNYTVKKMARRISSLLESIKTTHRSDLSLLQLDSDDILGRLINNFRDALVLFSETYSYLSNTAESAVAVSRQIEENLTRTFSDLEIFRKTISLIFSAADDLENQNDSMESGFAELNKATLLNVSNIIELYSNITEFGKMISAQAESTEDLMQSLGMMKSRISAKSGSDEEADSLKHISGNLGKNLISTIDTFRSLFDRTKKDLENIDDIAQRTNILSINTAIEAARVGKGGEGFRLISIDIKQLATEVHSLTEKINTEMAAGVGLLDSATSSLYASLDKQNEIIAGLDDSLAELNIKNRKVSGRMDFLTTNKEQIDSLLSEIKENMQKLKKFIETTHDSLNMVVNTSTIIHSGITTLFEKSDEIQVSQQKTNESLSGFNDHIRELMKFIG